MCYCLSVLHLFSTDCLHMWGGGGVTVSVSTCVTSALCLVFMGRGGWSCMSICVTSIQG